MARNLRKPHVCGCASHASKISTTERIKIGHSVQPLVSATVSCYRSIHQAALLLLLRLLLLQGVTSKLTAYSQVVGFLLRKAFMVMAKVNVGLRAGCTKLS